MKTLFQSALLATITILLVACNSNQADQTTIQFWQAIENEEFEQAARMTLKPSPTKLRLLTIPFRGQSAEIIDNQVQGNTAVVLTKLKSETKSEYILTMLVKQQDQWLIDDQAMLKSAVTYRLNRFAGNLSTDVDELLAQAITDLEASLDSLSQ